MRVARRVRSVSVWRWPIRTCRACGAGRRAPSNGRYGGALETLRCPASHLRLLNSSAGPAEKTKRPRSDIAGPGSSRWLATLPGIGGITQAGRQSNGHAAIRGLGETPSAPLPILAVAKRPRHCERRWTMSRWLGFGAGRRSSSGGRFAGIVLVP